MLKMTRNKRIIIALSVLSLFLYGTARADFIEEGTFQVKNFIPQAIEVVENPMEGERDCIYVLGARDEDRELLFVRKYTDTGEHLWSTYVDFNTFFADWGELVQIGPFLHRFNTIHVSGDKMYVAGYLLTDATGSSVVDRKCIYAEAVYACEDGRLIDQRILGGSFDYSASGTNISDVYYADDDMVYFVHVSINLDTNVVFSYISGFSQGFQKFAYKIAGIVQAVRKYGDDIYMVGKVRDTEYKFFIQRHSSGVFLERKAFFAAKEYYPENPWIEDVQIDDSGVYCAVTATSTFCHQYEDKGWTNLSSDDTIRTYCDHVWLSLHRLTHDLQLVWSRDTVVENPGYEWVFGRLIDLTEATMIANTHINLTQGDIYLTGTVMVTTIKSWETTFNNYLISFTKDGKRKRKQFFSEPKSYQYNPASAIYFQKPEQNAEALVGRPKLLMAVDKQTSGEILSFRIPKIITILEEYTKGWNLFSVPVDQAYKSKDYDFSVIYEYNYRKGYDRVRGWETLLPGYAYWGKADKDFKFLYRGNEILNIFLYPTGFDSSAKNCTWDPETERYNCNQDGLLWFMLGGCSYPWTYRGYPDVPPVVVYGWSKAHRGGYVRPQQLEPGNGYWTAFDVGNGEFQFPIELRVK